MGNNQATKHAEHPMPKALLPKLEPGNWLLWILASVTASTVVGNHVIKISYWLESILHDRFSFQLDSVVGGVIGGVIASIGVGFLPWLAQKQTILRGGWWAYTIISIAITVTAVIIAYFTIFDYGILVYITIFVIPVVGGSSIIALVARRIGHRLLNYKVRVWQWVLAGISTLIIGFAMLSYTVWMFRIL